MLSILAVCYLFLGGAGGGACFVLAVAALLSPRDTMAIKAPARASAYTQAPKAAMLGRLSVRRNADLWMFAPVGPYRRLFFAGYTISFAAIALGAACLVIDLARPEEVIFLFVNPNPSIMTWGAWLIALAIVLSVISIGLWGSLRKVRLVLVRIMNLAIVAVSIGVILYTGLLLGSISAVPLWATPWLPALFMFSSLSCGVALVLFAACFSDTLNSFIAAIRHLLVFDILVIVLELVAVTFVVLAASRGGSLLDVAGAAAHAVTLSDNAALLSVSELLFGDSAWVFWLGFVGMGLLAPLVFECIGLRGGFGSLAAMCTIASFVLIGGFAMRYSIVMSGMHPAVASVASML